MSNSSPSYAARTSGRHFLLCGLLGMLCCAPGVSAQNRPPKAIPVEEETDPGPAPAPNIPKAVPVPDSAPEPSSPKVRPAENTPRPAPGANPSKSPDDDLFDY